MNAGVEQLVEALGQRQPGDHQCALGEKRAGGFEPFGDGGIGGEITGAEVFGQRALENLGDFFRAPVRGFPGANGSGLWVALITQAGAPPL
jgi:hypothetical protein